jgi:hypothetical protein
LVGVWGGFLSTVYVGVGRGFVIPSDIVKTGVQQLLLLLLKQLKLFYSNHFCNSAPNFAKAIKTPSVSVDVANP